MPTSKVSPQKEMVARGSAADAQWWEGQRGPGPEVGGAEGEGPEMGGTEKGRGPRWEGQRSGAAEPCRGAPEEQGDLGSQGLRLGNGEAARTRETGEILLGKGRVRTKVRMEERTIGRARERQGV